MIHHASKMPIQERGVDDYRYVEIATKVRGDKETEKEGVSGVLH